MYMIKELILKKERVSSCLALFLSISLIFNSTVFVHPQETNNGDDNVEPTPLIEETPDEEVEIEEPIIETAVVEDPIIEEEEIEEAEVEESIVEDPIIEEEEVEEELRIEKATIEDPIVEGEGEVESNLIFIEEIIEEADDENDAYVQAFEACANGEFVGNSFTTTLTIVSNSSHIFVENGNKFEVRLNPQWPDDLYGYIELPRNSSLITRSTTLVKGDGGTGSTAVLDKIVHTATYSANLPCRNQVGTAARFEFVRDHRPVYEVKNKFQTSSNSLGCRIDDNRPATYFEGNAVCTRNHLFLDPAGSRTSNALTHSYSIANGTFANTRPNTPPTATITGVTGKVETASEKTTITSSPQSTQGPIEFKVQLVDNIEIENAAHMRNSAPFFTQQQDPITNTALLITTTESRCTLSAQNDRGIVHHQLSNLLDYKRIEGKTADEIKALFSDYDFELVKDRPHSYVFSEVEDALFFCLWATDGRAGSVSVIETEYDGEGPVINEQPSFNQDGPLSDSVIKAGEVDATEDLIDFTMGTDWTENSVTNVYYEVVDFGSTCDETSRGRVTALNTFHRGDAPVAGANKVGIFKNGGIFSSLTNGFTTNLVNQKFCFYLIDFFSNITTTETQSSFSVLPIVDNTPPTVSSVVFERIGEPTLAIDKKRAKQGDVVEITINFSEPVKSIGKAFPSQSNGGEFLFATESEINTNPSNHYYPVSQFNFIEVVEPTENAPRNNAIYRITFPFDETRATGPQLLSLFRLSRDTKDLSDNPLTSVIIRSNTGSKSRNTGVKDGTLHFDSKPPTGNINDITIVESTDPTKNISTDGTLINYGDPTFNIAGIPQYTRVQLKLFKLGEPDPIAEVITEDNEEISFHTEIGLLEEFEYHLDYRLVDNAGNTGTTKSFVFALDTTPPAEDSAPNFVAPFDTNSDDGVDNNTRGGNTLGYINKEQLANINNDRTRIIGPPVFGGSILDLENPGNITSEYGFAPNIVNSVCSNYIKSENDVDPLNFFSLAYFRSLDFADGEYKICRKYTDMSGNTATISDNLILVKDTVIPVVSIGVASEDQTNNEKVYNIVVDEGTTDISLFHVDKTFSDGTCDASETFDLSRPFGREATSIVTTFDEELCLRTTDFAGNVAYASIFTPPSDFDLATDSRPINPSNNGDYDINLTEDNITNAETLIITATAPAGSTVQLYVDDDVSGNGVYDGIFSQIVNSNDNGIEEADVNGNVHFTIDASSWEDGDYIISGTSELNGKTSVRAPEPLTITIDRTVPVLSAAPDLIEESDTCYTYTPIGGNGDGSDDVCGFGSKEDNITTDLNPQFDVGVLNEEVYVEFYNNNELNNGTNGYIRTRINRINPTTQQSEGIYTGLLPAGATEVFLTGNISALDSINGSQTGAFNTGTGEPSKADRNRISKDYALRYRYVDKAGNVSADSSVLNVTVDDRILSRPGTTFVDRRNSSFENDTGISNTDNITRNKTSQFIVESTSNNDFCTTLYLNFDDTSLEGDLRYVSPIVNINNVDEDNNPTGNPCDIDGVVRINLDSYSELGDRNIKFFTRRLSKSGILSSGSNANTTVTFDSTVAEAVLSLAPSSDSGVKGDGRTKDTTPEFNITNLEAKKSVSGSKSSKVTVYTWVDTNDDGDWLADTADEYSAEDSGELTAVQTYDFSDVSRTTQSFTSAALAEGIYIYVVKHEDDAGNITWTAPEKVVNNEVTGVRGDNVIEIDTTPILFSLLHPADSGGNQNEVILQPDVGAKISGLSISCNNLDRIFTIFENSDRSTPLIKFVNEDADLIGGTQYFIIFLEFEGSFDYSERCFFSIDDGAGNVKTLKFADGQAEQTGTRTINATENITFRNLAKTEDRYGDTRVRYFFDIYRDELHVGSAGLIDSEKVSTLTATTATESTIVLESVGRGLQETEIIFYAAEGYRTPTPPHTIGGQEFTSRTRTGGSVVGISSIISGNDYSIDIPNEFFIDKTAPNFISISAVRQGELNSPANKYAGKGDVVDITVTFDEPITNQDVLGIALGVNPVTNIGGTAVPAPRGVGTRHEPNDIPSSENPLRSVTYTITIPQSTRADGSIRVSFSNIRDQYNNNNYGLGRPGRIATSIDRVNEDAADFFFIKTTSASENGLNVALTAGSDTGYLNSDGITNESYPVFNFTGFRAGTAVGIEAVLSSISNSGSATKLNTIQLTGNGEFKFNDSTIPSSAPLADGNFRVGIVLIDNVGNRSVETAGDYNFTIDRTNPAFTLEEGFDIVNTSGKDQAKGIFSEELVSSEITMSCDSTDIGLSITDASIGGNILTEIGTSSIFLNIASNITSGTVFSSCTLTFEDKAGNSFTSDLGGFIFTNDTLAPSISSISAVKQGETNTPANKFALAEDTVDITVTFTEPTKAAVLDSIQIGTVDILPLPAPKTAPTGSAPLESLEYSVVIPADAAAKGAITLTYSSLIDVVGNERAANSSISTNTTSNNLSDFFLVDRDEPTEASEPVVKSTAPGFNRLDGYIANINIETFNAIAADDTTPLVEDGTPNDNSNAPIKTEYALGRNDNFDKCDLGETRNGVAVREFLSPTDFNVEYLKSVPEAQYRVCRRYTDLAGNISVFHSGKVIKINKDLTLPSATLGRGSTNSTLNLAATDNVGPLSAKIITPFTEETCDATTDFSTSDDLTLTLTNGGKTARATIRTQSAETVCVRTSDVVGNSITLSGGSVNIDFSGNGRVDTTDAIVFYIYAIFEGIGFAPIDNQKILESVLREEVNFTIEGSPRLSDSAEDVYNLLKSYSDSNAIDFSGNGRTDTTDAIVFYIYAIFEGIGFAPIDNQKILDSVLREEVNFTIEGSPRLSDSAEDVYNLLKSYSR